MDCSVKASERWKRTCRWDSKYPGLDPMECLWLLYGQYRILEDWFVLVLHTGPTGKQCFPSVLAASLNWWLWSPGESKERWRRMAEVDFIYQAWSCGSYFHQLWLIHILPLHSWTKIVIHRHSAFEPAKMWKVEESPKLIHFDRLFKTIAGDAFCTVHLVESGTGHVVHQVDEWEDQNFSPGKTMQLGVELWPTLRLYYTNSVMSMLVFSHRWSHTHSKILLQWAEWGTLESAD